MERPEFLITSSTTNTQYECTTSILVKGNYVTDALTGNLLSVYGDLYRLDSEDNVGERFGSFNGAPGSNGDIEYDPSKMTRADNLLFWQAVAVIEQRILGEDDESEQ